MTVERTRTTHGLLQAIPIVIAAGCIISAVGFGPRSTMGFFLTPISNEYGWGREVFALAIAVQNLVWGIGQPFVGMLADRYGTARVLAGGALIYAAGLALMAHSGTPLALQLTAGVMVGFGIAGSAFLLVMAAFARLLPASMRTLGFGLGTAAGSVGQFIFAPLGQGFIGAYGWQTALAIMAGILMVVPLLAFVMRGKPGAAPVIHGQSDQTILEAMREAFSHGSYRLLVSGFFVCGFQLAFITVHLPPYLIDVGIPAMWGAYAIGLIGLANIMGSIVSGVLSDRMARRIILVWLYVARSALIAAFILLPPSIPSTLIFSALIGFLWLSTVPPTQQIVAVMFGTRYMATLFGFVFFSHQVGSFLGVWLGGYLFDLTGSYSIVWWLCVTLGIFAAIVHWPIVERAVERPAMVG